MNRLRILLITAVLMTGGSALASAQVYEHGGRKGGDHNQGYRNEDRGREGASDRHFNRSYGRDDHFRNFDDNRGSRGRDGDDHVKNQHRDNYRDRR
jgi:hypothetical protein